MTADLLARRGTARLPNLLGRITMARADGSQPKRMAVFAKATLIAQDDWGLDCLVRGARKIVL